MENIQVWDVNIGDLSSCLFDWRAAALRGLRAHRRRVSILNGIPEFIDYFHINMKHRHFIAIILIIVPLPSKFSLLHLFFKSLCPSPHSAFLLSLSPLSSPVFVSPLLSSPFLSSLRPSVSPIWLSHLSWELSQGTRLLIQFLLNLMALGSAFAIAAARRETKQGGKNWKPLLETE